MQNLISVQHILIVIRFVTDVLRAQSRFVKFTHFTNLLWARSTLVTDIVTNISRRQPLFTSRDVNAATRLAEASLRCDNIYNVHSKKCNIRLPYVKRTLENVR